MKKILLALSIIGFTSCGENENSIIQTNVFETNVDSHKITVSQAEQNALLFIQDMNAVTRSSAETPVVDNVVAYTNNTETCNTGEPCDTLLYFINFKDNNGFVVASADDRYVPVFAYIEEGNYSKEDTPNPGFEMFLENILHKYTDKDDTSLLKESVAGMRSIGYAGPYVLAKWGNGAPYNMFSAGSTCTPMGVALAQIASYYMYPDSVTYHDDGITYTSPLDWYNILTVSAQNYQHMPTGNPYSTQIAHLIHYIEYNFTEETTTLSQICLAWFSQLGYNYTTMTSLYSSYDDEIVRTALDAGQLIYARAYQTKNNNLYSNGHSWVIDGYNSNYYHCNWGWDGSYNGLFLRTGFNPGYMGSYQYQLAYSVVSL